jgi:RNA polymerase subunit RPABC4/transcription elongation factor Spt4
MGDTTQPRASFAIKALAEDKQLVFGYCYVAVRPDGSQVVDHSGEFVPLAASEAFEDAIYEFVRTSRVGGEMHLRSCSNCNSLVTLAQWEPLGGLTCPVCGQDTLRPKQIGTVIESVVLTPEKSAAMGMPPGTVPQLAWWLGLKIDDAATWAKVKSGEYRAFSFGHISLRPQEARRAA